MKDALEQSAGAYKDRFELVVVLMCAMSGTLMQALDTTIANVSLPYMQGGLQASRDQITWVLTSYIVAAAIMTAPVGWFAARFGRKNIAVISLAGFTVASMLCGMARSLDEIVLFRLLQGIFGAALAPLSQAIMLDLYPLEKRGQAMAIWGMGIMVGPILGPTLGGYLTDHYSWRWVFYVNVPFGVAAVTGIWLYLRDTPRDRQLRFDWTGFGVLSLGIGALQLMLDRGETKDWFGSGEIVSEAVLAGLGLYLFSVHMLTTEKPFIPKAMFKDINYASALVLMFMIGIVILASSALLPPYLQDLAGYSVTDTGLLMAPRGIATMFAMMLVGKVANRVDARILLTFGSALVLWSMWRMAHWTPDISINSFLVTMIIQGLGLGFTFIPANLVAFATLTGSLRTDAAAFLNLIRNVGSAIGVSVTTTILADCIQVSHASMAAHVSTFNRALTLNAQSMLWNPQIPFGLQSINGVIERNAQIIAYSNDYLFMFVTCLPVLAIIALMRAPPKMVPTGAKESAELEMMVE
ncbi:MAG: DHA2 family efflux MFS transporter permease subunit [Alphaproteobacteria bacterium]|nr:DHA2 family efflux MFS transporter permease subunit [Alphaproteobacteria bacterium]MBU6471078.1 DHA2 family efflux MFS transporter permease subunit [Alphaproteobacteria bacterium]MDE2012491.1 DHA2 family efflux MFS transporter permease subunit [Alphaproteobacteria bacterium]MDE2072789.1 DHA2 family efflux MFS transporter permease subunit [Alphaproteobacteria bacterium]MDE2352380.1 DHA2 family efflux MFS transporter permease subunit [Alphaproteobacteria bacterium]